jgi:hypothetical protein
MPKLWEVLIQQSKVAADFLLPLLEFAEFGSDHAHIGHSAIRDSSKNPLDLSFDISPVNFQGFPRLASAVGSPNFTESRARRITGFGRSMIL